MAEQRDDVIEMAAASGPNIPPVPEEFEVVPNVPGRVLPRIITEPMQGATPPVPEEFLPSRPTTAERVREVAIGVPQGAVKFGPATAGLVAGAKAGAAMAPFTGPLAPAMPFIGGAAGAIGGYFLGEKLDDFFPAPPREDLVPYREGGITAGGVLASAPAAFFMRGDQATRVGRLIDYIGTAARANKARYMGIESLTAATTGLAGGVSEAYFPGEAGPRFGAELAASVFTPGRFLLNTTTTAYDGLKNIVRSARDPNAVQARQANALYNVLDRVLAEVPAIKQLEELGTDAARLQAQQLRDRYYKNLIRDLEKVTPGGATPTAAQKTGDIGLSVLELSLAKGDPAFGSIVRQQGLDAMKANQLLIDSLNRVEDQRALALAAQLQAKLYDGMVEGRLGIAERLAADKARNINVNVPESRARLGAIVKGEVETALEEAREYERRLWTSAMQSTATRTITRGARAGEVVEREMVPKQLLRSYLDQISNMTMERATMGMPAEIKAIMTRLGITQESIAAYQKGKLTQQYRDTGIVPDEFLTSGIETLKNGNTRFLPLGNKTTVQDLINIRSDLLKFARDAAAGTSNRSPSDAAFYGMLAEGVLDDLQTLNSAAYDKARAFSKSLNDTFRRTYANQVTALERTGAQKIPAELLVSRAFGRDSDVTSLRMDQIEGAVGFFRNAYQDAVQNFGANSPQAAELKPFADAAGAKVSSVTEAMEKVLRLAASDPSIVNPQTGRVNPQALANWMTRRQELLRPFGSLTNDLKSALDAENAFRAMNDPASAAARQIREQQDFAALLPGGERPSSVISDILNGRNPVSNLRRVIAVATDPQGGGGPAAINGLKSTLFEYAYTKAGGTTGGKFSIQAFDDALFKPLAPNQPSIVNLMRSSGLMSLTEVKNLRRLMEPMKNIESAMNNRVYLDQVIEGTGPVGDLAVRLLALHGAAGAVPQGPGSLAAASAISKAAKDVFNQLPRLNALAALKESMQDPILTASLLRVGRTDAEKAAILQNIKDRMSAAGLLVQVAPRAAVPAATATPMTQQEIQERRDASRMLRALPPAPTTRGVPNLQPPAPQKGPGAQGPAGAPSQSRAMLQSLFPFDTISAMAAQPQQPQPPA